MAVDLRKVKKLIELVEESGIAELEVSSGDESVRIARYQNTSQVVTRLTSEEPVSATLAPPVAAGGQNIAAPMAGTFYRAPHPDADPFVEIGQSVSPGEVVCIIESMKMMHEIRAGEAGTVASINVDNGQPVNTGDVLYTLS